MKKTLRKSSVILLLVASIVLFSSCMKKSLIDTYEKTYAVHTEGSSDFFVTGGQFDQMVAQGKVKVYVSPDVYVVTGQDDAVVSSYSKGFTDEISKAMKNYGYEIVDNEDEADFVMRALNLKLIYSLLAWGPGTSYLDPYLVFWGGYYPWLPVYSITFASNILCVEMIEATSLRKYRDWYKNVWLPSNPGKTPGKSHVPAEYKITIPWQADIIGELEDKNVNDNTRLITNLPSAFVQSPYLEVNR